MSRVGWALYLVLCMVISAVVDLATGWAFLWRLAVCVPLIMITYSGLRRVFPKETK